jgi:Flp pilus assembly protein TadB
MSWFRSLTYAHQLALVMFVFLGVMLAQMALDPRERRRRRANRAVRRYYSTLHKNAARARRAQRRHSRALHRGGFR